MPGDTGDEEPACRNAGSAGILTGAFRGKQNCLQKICGKENIFEGGGVSSQGAGGMGSRKLRAT
jgi:hypothetical protein